MTESAKFLVSRILENDRANNPPERDRNIIDIENMIPQNKSSCCGK